MSSQSFSLYYDETPFMENAVDLVIENNKIYKSYYLQQKRLSHESIEHLIHQLIVENDFIMDKEYKESREFVDSKSGSVRFIIWNDNSVEKMYKVYLGEATPDFSLVL